MKNEFNSFTKTSSLSFFKSFLCMQFLMVCNIALQLQAISPGFNNWVGLHSFILIFDWWRKEQRESSLNRILASCASSHIELHGVSMSTRVASGSMVGSISLIPPSRCVTRIYCAFAHLFRWCPAVRTVIGSSLRPSSRWLVKCWTFCSWPLH